MTFREIKSVHKRMTPPESITVLKSLLGAAGYLSKYVPEYAQLVSPLLMMADQAIQTSMRNGTIID